MARPWKPRIYATPDLLLKAQVRQIASATQLDHYAVLGRLIEFWLEAQVKATDDGLLEGKFLAWLDSKVGRPGFAGAMVEAGWLDLTVKGIKVPDFDVLVSKKAVRRIENAMRMALVRNLAAGTTATLCSGCAENVRQTPAQPNPKKPRTSKKTATPDLPIDAALAERFHRWWGAYPKHRKFRYKSCKKLFEAIAPDDAMLDRMLAALERQKRSDDWIKEESQYVPAADNYLRDERWIDAEPGRPLSPRGRVESEPGQFADRRPYKPRKAPPDPDAAPQDGGRLF